MALTPVYTCDVCGIHKGKGNHWFMVSEASGLIIHRWTDIDMSPFRHICGEKCLHTELSRWAAGEKPTALPIVEAGNERMPDDEIDDDDDDEDEDD